MPMYNFQKQFVPAVESGEKRHTIRARRKNRPQVGQIAYLYTGARTKACRKLGEHRILDVLEIQITKYRVYAIKGLFNDKKPLDEFARDDGFKDWDEMCSWFEKTHGLPFKGDLIKW